MRREGDLDIINSEGTTDPLPKPSRNLLVQDKEAEGINHLGCDRFIFGEWNGSNFHGLEKTRLNNFVLMI